MDERIQKLEATAEKTADRLQILEENTAERFSAIDRDMAVIKSNYATKADIAETKAAIAEAKSTIIMWVVSAIFLAQVLPALLKQFGLSHSP